MIISDKDWEAREAARTLAEAERIKHDEALMGRVNTELERQKSEIAAIQRSTGHVNKLATAVPPPPPGTNKIIAPVAPVTLGPQGNPRVLWSPIRTIKLRKEL